MGALLDIARRAATALSVPSPEATIRPQPSAHEVADVIAEIHEIRGHRATATPQQEAELRELVAIVSADWPDRNEALAVALADPADALTCFRALAAEVDHVRGRAGIPIPAGPYTSAPLAERDPKDERRTCKDCANLSPIGRCLAAARGKRIHASRREYHPIPDLLGRCEHFMPLPDDPDQRPGAQRWLVHQLANHAE